MFVYRGRSLKCICIFSISTLNTKEEDEMTSLFSTPVSRQQGKPQYISHPLIIFLSRALFSLCCFRGHLVSLFKIKGLHWLISFLVPIPFPPYVPWIPGASSAELWTVFYGSPWGVMKCLPVGNEQTGRGGGAVGAEVSYHWRDGEAGGRGWDIGGVWCHLGGTHTEKNQYRCSVC